MASKFDKVLPELGVNFRPTPSPRLYRTGDCTGITDAAASVLKDRLGIEMYLDLRSPSEIEVYGTPTSLIKKGIRWQVQPLLGYSDEPIRKLQPSDIDYADYYMNICCEAGDLLCKTFSAIARHGDRILMVGCHLGKDRTGVVTAILLRLQGVSVRDVVKDYAASGSDLKKNIERFEDKWVRKGLTRKEYQSRIETSGQTMVHFLKQVDQKFGSIRGFLQRIGVSEPELDKLKAMSA